MTAYTAAAAIPSQASASVAPSNTAVYSPPYLGFRALAAGTLTVVPAGSDDGSATPPTVAYTTTVGMVEALQISRFMSTGTTLTEGQFIAYGPR